MFGGENISASSLLSDGVGSDESAPSSFLGITSPLDSLMGGFDALGGLPDIGGVVDSLNPLSSLSGAIPSMTGGEAKSGVGDLSQQYYDQKQITTGQKILNLAPNSGVSLNVVYAGLGTIAILGLMWMKTKT